MPRHEQHQIRYCRLCQDKVERVDYKDEKRLARFITEQGKMVPRRVTRTCGRHQRQLAEAIKRARFMALLPYVGRHHRHG